MKYIIFSRFFPSHHIKAGEPTFFVEKIYHTLFALNQGFNIDLPFEVDIQMHTQCELPKGHTIRNGKRWKPGDTFSPKVWLDQPYKSKQIVIAPPITVVSTYDITYDGLNFHLNGQIVFKGLLTQIANNDGLSLGDLKSWFNQKPFKPLDGQIICWDPRIAY